MKGTTPSPVAEQLLERRNRELAALRDLSISINVSLSLKETAQAILQGMLDAVQPDMVVLFLLDGDKLSFYDSLPYKTKPSITNVTVHRVGECLCGLAVESGSPVYSSDIQSDARCTYDECKQAGITSFVALPLQSGERRIGVIGLASLATRDFNEQAAFLETIGSLAAVSLRNAQLFEATQKELEERKQVEETLREAESRYRGIVENIQDCFYRSDARGRLVYVSSSGVSFLGYESAEELYGQPMESFWRYPEKRQVMLDFLNRDGLVRDYEVEILRRDGSVVTVATTSSYYYDKEGSVQGVQGIFRDITQRLQVAEVIAGERNFSNDIINTMPGIFYMFDGGGSFVRWNHRFMEVTGYTSEELLGKFVLDFFAEEDKEYLASRVKAVFTEGESFAEAPFLLKDGTRIPYYFTGRLAVLNGQQYLLGVGMDMSKQKRVESALRQSEELYTSIIAASTGGIFDWHMSGKPHFEYTSERWNEIHGVPSGESISFRQWRKMIHPDDVSTIDRNISEHIAGRTPVSQSEYRIKDESGEEKWLLGRAKAIFNDHGQPMRMVGIVSDITPRKKAEAKEKMLYEQLTQAQKMESVGRLAGGVAHDFNNMLSAILGHAELALSETELEEGLAGHLETIKQSTLRSAELTRQLLAFARKQPVKPKVLDLNDTISSMLKMLLRLIGEDIDLVWKPRANLWPVKIDPSQVDQILVNLVINARDAILGTGKLTIESDHTTFDEAYCLVHPGFKCGDYVMLAISDDGCGIDKELLKHIFEPFFTTKELGKGTGLGLATVYGTVKQNNGFINVYSEENIGTTFRIYLPRFKGKYVEPETEGDKRANRGLGETVLLVEDEASVLMTTKKMLEQLGYLVIPAASPKEALQLAEANIGNMDLVVTDVVMPEMNGSELAKVITKLQPGIQCLFISGYTADVIGRHGLLDENVFFLQKPFSMKDIAATIRKILDSD